MDKKNQLRKKLEKPTADKHIAESVSLNSYSDINSIGMEGCPPPIPLSYSDVLAVTEPNQSMEERLSAFKMDKDGTLKIACKEIKKRQRAALTKVFKQAAVKLLEGKNVVGMSLPINIFQPRSTIERLGDLFRLFPHYCDLAAESDDEIERIKLVTCAVVGSCQFQMNQWKPFNPILGETYQCRYNEHTEMFLEHTSHHPAISNFYLKGRKWTCYGAILYNGKVRPNTVTLFSETWSTVRFHDGKEIKFNWPWLQMGNFLIGTRKISMIKMVCVKSEEAKIKCVVKFNKEVKKKMLGLVSVYAYNELYGSLYIYDPFREMSMIKKKFYDTVSSMCKMKDVEHEIEKVSGNWLKNLCFDGKEYWSAQDLQIVGKQVSAKTCLPSSFRYREDLIWLYYGDLERAGVWKDILEVQQRKERKIRNKGTKIREMKNKPKKKSRFLSMFRSNKT